VQMGKPQVSGRGHRHILVACAGQARARSRRLTAGRPGRPGRPYRCNPHRDHGITIVLAVAIA
jgi:hypothetical protein